MPPTRDRLTWLMQVESEQRRTHECHLSLGLRRAAHVGRSHGHRPFPWTHSDDPIHHARPAPTEPSALHSSRSWSRPILTPGRAGEFKLGERTLKVPGGFVIEPMAGPPLVDRPITAAFDEQGRLYVSDSSGSNDNVQKQLAERPHRIVRLEDRDGDGRYDTRTVFADKMMFPEGTMWHDGSLYVSAPPSIWKLTDTDGDGVADRASRVVPGQDAHRLRQRPARPLPRPRRLDLLVQGGLRPADVRAPGQDAVRHPRGAHLPLPARRHRHRAGDDRRHGQSGRRRLHARAASGS